MLKLQGHWPSVFSVVDAIGELMPVAWQVQFVSLPANGQPLLTVLSAGRKAAKAGEDQAEAVTAPGAHLAGSGPSEHPTFPLEEAVGHTGLVPRETDRASVSKHL